MVEAKFDPGLDHLLALDGVVLVVDPVGNHWVKFVVKRVEPSSKRPHGLSYSLTSFRSEVQALNAFQADGKTPCVIATPDCLVRQATFSGPSIVDLSNTQIGGYAQDLWRPVKPIRLCWKLSE